MSSIDRMCLICMENNLTSTISLFNRKNQKTQICVSFEAVTNLQINDTNNKLPQEICIQCVAELNKCFNFREKCLRTFKTLQLAIYNDDDDDDDDDERAKEQEISENHEIVDRDISTSNLIDISSLTYPLTQAENKKIENQEGVILVYCIDESESQKEEQTKSVYKCVICDLEFSRKKNLENHSKRFHANVSSDDIPLNKKIRLQLCKEKTADDANAKQKLLDNPEAKKCKYCDALFLNEKSLHIHEKKQSCQQNNYYKCTKCQKVFTNLLLFQEHENAHNQKEEVVALEPSKKYKCEYENCLKSFNMISTLKDHTRTHDNTKPFVCSICNRGFSQNTNLKQHIRRHNQIKPFKCNWDLSICNKTFVSKGELESHLRKHSGLHPFECTYSTCSSKFTTSSSLVKHKRIHSGEKPYACDFCPMRFTALGTLKNHQKTHTGERPYSCKFCNKSFTQKSDMKSHERIHTLTKPYECYVCQMNFHQAGTLKTHMKVHSTTTMELL